MRKFFLSLVMIFMTATLFAAPVSREDAQNIAISFYSGHAPFSFTDYSVSGVYTRQENGVYKYIGVLMPPLPPPKNLHAVATDYTVILTWEPPDTISPPLQALGYNMYRNGTRINISPITAVTYQDNLVTPGDYSYCVTAIYNLGESGSDCDSVGVAVSTIDKQEGKVTIAPNPARDQLYLQSNLQISTARMFDISGREARQWIIGGTSKTLDISGLPAGYYTLSLATGQGIITARVLIR